MNRWLAMLTLPVLLGTAPVSGAKEGDELLGEPAPPLAPLTWAQNPVKDADLRGKVVLVRWWTEGCSLCKSTAPALNRLHADFAGRGLVVVGVFHPKPPRVTRPEEVRQAASALGFRFPIASDDDWSVLRRWWLGSGDRSYTSVSFLLDRSGRVRYVHPGGEFFASDRPDHAQQDRDYREIRGTIERLLDAG